MNRRRYGQLRWEGDAWNFRSHHLDEQGEVTLTSAGGFYEPTVALEIMGSDGKLLDRKAR